MAIRMILIGPPGVGKGTQAALLRDRLKVEHLSSGEIFRAEIDAETDLGRLAKRYIDEGRLVPNGITVEMMAKRLRKDAVRQHGFILDGYPRTVRQAEELVKDLEGMGLKIDTVVSLSAPQEVVVQRLANRGRGDDDEETVRRRMLVFYEETEPVIEYFRRQGIFHEVDANQDVETVYSEVVKGLPV